MSKGTRSNMPTFIWLTKPTKYLDLRLSSARSPCNIGWRVVSITYDRWQHFLVHSGSHDAVSYQVSLVWLVFYVVPLECSLWPGWLAFIMYIASNQAAFSYAQHSCPTIRKWLSRSKVKVRYQRRWHRCCCTHALPRYAGVPTMERRNDFSPMILAKPKSHNFTWNAAIHENNGVLRTHNRLGAQTLESFLWLAHQAVRFFQAS